MATNPLLEGNLSVKIAGTERISVVHGLQYSTVMPGGFGPASFWVATNNPWSVQADYPELDAGAAVVVKHNSVVLYEGQIANDPHVAAVSDGVGVIPVECEGLLNVAARRDDFCYMWVDDRFESWLLHPLSNENFACTNDGLIGLRNIPGADYVAGDRAMFYYQLNKGLERHQSIKRIDFDFEMDVDNPNWNCCLVYGALEGGSGAYPQYLNTTAWGGTNDWVLTGWTYTNSAVKAGKAYVTFTGDVQAIGFVLRMLSTVTSSNKRYLKITNVRVYATDTSGTAPRVDQAMVAVAVTSGLAATNGSSTVGSALDHLTVEPYTTRADALAQISAQHEAIVDWGFWDSSTFKCAERLTNNTTIRALAGVGVGNACYLIDGDAPGIDYDVHADPERSVDYVKAVYRWRDTKMNATQEPSGTTWPSDWYRDNATNVTAYSSQFQLVANTSDPDVYCATPAASGDLTAMYRADYGEVVKVNLNRKYLNVPAGSGALLMINLECYSSNLSYLGVEEGTGESFGGVGEITQDQMYSFRVELCQYPTTYYVRPKLTWTRDLGTGSCTVRCDNVFAMRDLKAGMLRTTYYGKDTSLASAPADARVQLLDLTGQVNLSDLRAYDAAKQQYLFQQAALESGTITIRTPTVPIYSGGTKNAAYIRAGDWIENAKVSGHVPRMITGCQVDVEGGRVALSIQPPQWDVVQAMFGHKHGPAVSKRGRKKPRSARRDRDRDREWFRKKRGHRKGW